MSNTASNPMSDLIGALHAIRADLLTSILAGIGSEADKMRQLHDVPDSEILDALLQDLHDMLTEGGNPLDAHRVEDLHKANASNVDHAKVLDSLMGENTRGVKGKKKVSANA